MLSICCNPELLALDFPTDKAVFAIAIKIPVEVSRHRPECRQIPQNPLDVVRIKSRSVLIQKDSTLIPPPSLDVSLKIPLTLTSNSPRTKAGKELSDHKPQESSCQIASYSSKRLLHQVVQCDDATAWQNPQFAGGGGVKGVILRPSLKLVQNK